MIKNTLEQSIVSVSVLSGTKMAALAVSFVILLTWVSPVFAGFEWKAPVPTPPPVVVSTQPVATPAQNDILWDKNIHKMPTQKVQNVETFPITISDKSMMDGVVTDRVVINEAPEIIAQPLPVGVISGFGTKLPLKIALQQIIPPIYKVLLSPGVNQEILVSWRGERPWEQVLTDMLSFGNLGFSRQNNVITISMLPIIYPSAPTFSSQKMIKNTSANKADMIPEDLIYSDRVNKAKIPSTVKSHFNAPTLVVVSPIKQEPVTNVIRINPLPRTENNIIKTKKLKTVTIRRDKPTPTLISRILRLNNDEKKNKAVPWPKKTATTSPSVKKAVKKIPTVSISQKASINSADVIPDNKKVDLDAYYRAEQVLENKKADMIPSDMISNRTVEMSLRIEKPAPLTKKAPSLNVDKFQAVSSVLEPKVKMAKVKITGISPDVRSPSWSASGGQTLRTILSDWSRTAKVELHWDIDYDYRLNEDVAYKGSFNNAVEKLLDRYTKVRPQPYGRLIQKHGGDNILIVNSYDLSH